MKARVEHPDFVQRRLKVESAGWWRRPRLYQDGLRVMPRRGVHLLTSDRGDTTPARLRYDYLDPMPVLRLGRQDIRLLRPFAWYDYLWLCLPLWLVWLGGVTGLLVGALAAHTNGLLFRSEQSLLRRYAWTAGVDLAALLILLFLKVVLRAASIAITGLFA